MKLNEMEPSKMCTIRFTLSTIDNSDVAGRSARKHIDNLDIEQELEICLRESR